MADRSCRNSAIACWKPRAAPRRSRCSTAISRSICCLTDIVMPGGVNGRQLADQAARRRPGLKVLFMTGYAPNAIFRQRTVSTRRAQLIGKPFSFDELAAKVRETLSK